MARGAALALVQEQQAHESYGDSRLTEEAISNWKKGQRLCRGRKRHNWGPYNVYVHATYYDVVEQCPHCRNRRHAPFSKQGRKLDKWKPDYRDGYLLPKGAAPITEELQDELVLQDILTRRMVEVPDEEDD